MKRWVLAVFLFAGAATSFATQPYLVKDINPGGVAADSNPQGFYPLGNGGVFLAHDSDRGQELWRTDGSPAGTFLLADACAGNCSGDGSPYLLTPDRYFYFVRNELFESELWWTDGTVAKTRPFLLSKAITELGSARIYLPSKRLLLFAAWDPAHGQELWSSDGSAPGTHIVHEFAPGAASSAISAFRFLGDRVVFGATATATSQKGLWISDGTPAGTKLVKNPYPHDLYSVAPLESLGNRVLLEVDVVQGSLRKELWITDGTSAGTKRIAAIPARPYAWFQDTAMLGGRAYLVLGDDKGQELWTSNGTASGTRRLTHFTNRAPFGLFLLATWPVRGSQILFRADDGVHGGEPWVTDGTVAGTHLLRDICPGPCSSEGGRGVKFGSDFYTMADDGVHGAELWLSDGTGTGTRMFKDLCPGACGSQASPADTFGGRLLFYAREAPGAVQSLWSTDGLPSHSVRLTALPRNNSEFTFSAVRTARGLVFPGSGPEGVELWRSNGLRAGTRLVTDIDPSILGGSNPTPFAALGDRVFFYAADGVHGEQLWTSRGDADNTERLSSFSGNWSPCDRGGFSPSHAEGSTLEFFAGYDSGTSHLWRTDGTAEGTFALAPYVCAASNGAAVVGDALFFSDQNKLFRSDGSVAGTQQVTALGDGSIEWIDTAPVIGGKLVVKQGSATRTTRFVATDGSVAGSQELLDNRPVACVAALGQKLLWVLGAEGASAANAFATSDISGAAPQEISDLGLAPGEYVAGCRTVLSESRSFWFLDVQGGTSSSHRLWVSDGTAEGTTRLADDVQIGDGLIGPSATATLDGVLYFGGEQAAGNFELWMSDGTPAGTAPWRLAGQSLAVEDLAAFQDRLILVIRDLRGRELWESDGSQGGTSLLGKLPDGSIGAPRLVPTTTRLFYRGEGLTTGIELWALRPN